MGKKRSRDDARRTRKDRPVRPHAGGSKEKAPVAGPDEVIDEDLDALLPMDEAGGADEAGVAKDDAVPGKGKGPTRPSSDKEREARRIEKQAEKEADEFRRKLKDRRGAFTPSTVIKKAEAPVKMTWKPIAAGILLIAVSVIGLVTSTNLIMTANDSPLYSADSGGIKGFVLNEDNERLAGAKVTFEGTDLVTYTNENGKFVFKKVPRGEHDMVATYPGYVTVRFPTMILGGTNIDRIGDTNLTLPKATVRSDDLTTGTASVKGTVYDNNGNPEMNATVRDLVNGKNLTTGSDGRFDLGQLSIGPGEIKVVRSLYKEQTVRFYVTPDREELKVYLTPGDGSETVDMTDGTVTITGRVVDPAGNPVPNALVDANGTAVPTDASGHFSLTVEAGEVTVTGTAIGMSSTAVKVMVDESGAEIEIGVQASTTKILDGDREPLRSPSSS
jgi:hypothetical protein